MLMLVLWFAVLFDTVERLIEALYTVSTLLLLPCWAISSLHVYDLIVLHRLELFAGYFD